MTKTLTLSEPRAMDEVAPRYTKTPLIFRVKRAALPNTYLLHLVQPRRINQRWELPYVSYQRVKFEGYSEEERQAVLRDIVNLAEIRLGIKFAEVQGIDRIGRLPKKTRS